MYAVFVIGVVVVAVVGAVILRHGPAAWLHRPLRRLATVRDTARVELGDHLAALAVLLAAAAAAIVVCWPFGRFARRFEPQIDRPWLHWTQRHVASTGGWHHLNAIVTKMGNRPEIKVVCVVAVVAFGLLWWRRRWWVPLLALAAAFGFEKFGQTALKDVADRHQVHLPHFGGYPSGGCARTIVIYGVVFYLILLTWPTISRSWRVAGWTLIALLGFIEGYTRVYLIKHWGMDVVGGWLFGTLLLLAMVAAMSCLAPGGSREGTVSRR